MARVRTYFILIVLTIFIFAFFGVSLQQATAAGQRLGGMNLGGYCSSIGQNGVSLNGSTWVCTPSNNALDMNAACQWQYPGQNAVASQDSPGNPYSWTCYAGSAPVTPTATPTQTVLPTPTASAIPTPTTSVTSVRLGGMNLGGYCQSIGQSNSSLNGSTWVCTPSGSSINMNGACQWQYANSSAFAQEDSPNNPYSWSCYSGGSAVPTPTSGFTPTATPTIKPTATPTPTTTPTPTQGSAHYLALGDSFAFGYHLAQYNQEIANHTYSASSFNDGYDTDFYNYLKGKLSGINEVNYSCPGETSGSFVNGGCAFHSSTSSLHSSYPTNQVQLQAAVNYLQQNPSSVVTIDIGVNDAINLSNTCQAQSNPASCYSQRTQNVLNTEKQNYDTILNALQKAAPSARIILIKSPDPVYYDSSDALVSGINQIVDNEASSRGLREANTYSIFNSSNVCSLTNFCASPSDFHPNASGYSAMASAIESVSGY